MEQIVTEKVVVTRKRLDSYLIECENKEGYLFTVRLRLQNKHTFVKHTFVFQ